MTENQLRGTQCMKDLQTLYIEPNIKIPKEALPIIETLEDGIDGFWTYKDRLPQVTEDIKITARRVKEIIADEIKPAEKKWVIERVYTLLAHFYQKDLKRSVYLEVAQDWYYALHTYPDWAITKARHEWLSKSNKKPAPSDIAILARKALSKYKALSAQCDRILNAEVEDKSLTPEEMEEAKKRVKLILREIKR